jgi:ABC-2 type transport system permease protein
MLVAQLKAELIKLWRVPAFLVFSVAFPIVLYACIGLPRSDARLGGVSASAYILASLATYGVVSVMLHSFGNSLANERAQRMHVLMRATPLPGWIHLTARSLTAVGFGLAVLLALCLFGAIIGNVDLPLARWAVLIGSLLLGSLPFLTLGLGIGYLVSPGSAPAAINLVLLPLSFASGLFVPVSQLPDLVQRVAPFLPTYHLARVAWYTVGAETPDVSGSVLWLVAYGVVFMFLALRALEREETRQFG